MKLVAVLFITILTCVTGDNELIKFRVFDAYGLIDDEWIRLGVNKEGFLYQVNIMQEITGDDWAVHYVIVVNRVEKEEGIVPFCVSTGTIQDVNIVQLFKTPLGLKNQECPIQMQVIMNTKNTFDGYLELDDYKKNDSLEIALMLMKGDQEISMIGLYP